MTWRPVDISDAEVEAFVRPFKDRAVFYLDESVGPAVAEMLAGIGFKPTDRSGLRLAGA